MGEQEKSPPEPSTEHGEPIIHIHILMNRDDGSVVTTISLSEEEDWSEHMDYEDE